MIVHIQVSPEDPIHRCTACEYCIFEDILLPEQRKIKVLNLKIPDNHVHRITIEQICGSHYDEVCPMKYAAMRAYCDDRTAMQIGVVKNYVWDLGKAYKRKVEFDHALVMYVFSPNGTEKRVTGVDTFGSRFRILLRSSRFGYSRFSILVQPGVGGSPPPVRSTHHPG